jgi:hypothetical protein
VLRLQSRAAAVEHKDIDATAQGEFGTGMYAVDLAQISRIERKTDGRGAKAGGGITRILGFAARDCNRSTGINESLCDAVANASCCAHYHCAATVQPKSHHVTPKFWLLLSRTPAQKARTIRV